MGVGGTSGGQGHCGLRFLRVRSPSNAVNSWEGAFVQGRSNSQRPRRPGADQLILETVNLVPFPVVCGIGQILLHRKKNFLQRIPVDGGPYCRHISVAHFQLRHNRIKNHRDRAMIRTVSIFVKLNASHRRKHFARHKEVVQSRTTVLSPVVVLRPPPCIGPRSPWV